MVVKSVSCTCSQVDLLPDDESCNPPPTPNPQHTHHPEWLSKISCLQIGLFLFFLLFFFFAGKSQFHLKDLRVTKLPNYCYPCCFLFCFLSVLLKSFRARKAGNVSSMKGHCTHFLGRPELNCQF